MRYDLVIFDCDGVLVDSERITAAIFAGMLEEIGLKVGVAQIFDRFVGRSMDQCLGIIAGLLGRPVPAGFAEDYRVRSAAALAAGVRPVAGIEAAIAALRVPYCVASNGTHDKMRTTLGATGLLDAFGGRLFSVSDVERGKPFPDLFLHAAARFGSASDPLRRHRGHPHRRRRRGRRRHGRLRLLCAHAAATPERGGRPDNVRPHAGPARSALGGTLIRRRQVNPRNSWILASSSSMASVKDASRGGRPST